ncbi:hypothetical protein BJ123_11366 [Rhodopseudomonas thermotolerans]|uniref:Protease inhibitor Inh n=2 Tax=Rhodopseudomonas TaxID=1073 RepID=A0A336JPY4_9BRAD|nr:hypothetical protein BJ125_11366 [Rhodopseudomonas pentothenatexigens]REF93357.1 hypothetical protein BJ123_11366 [Rhodopseudomonas thermotolerans]SSW91648.1 hypothetical protein SAMN05892882_11366 [Rhodopseudomonas pentothenatexigens]
MKRLFVALVLAGMAISPVLAQQEPWGGNVLGWKFTQTAEANNVVNCRATQGQNIVSRRNNGKHYLSVPAPTDLPQGWYREGRASIIIGGNAEPVDAEKGGRLAFYVDDGQLTALSRARGYQWRVAGPRGILTGSASFTGDVGKAVAELHACVKANTVAAPQPGSAAPAPARTIAKWSGPWVWINPLTLFGKPVDTRGQRLSIELLPNNRVNICTDLRRNDTCKNAPFTERSGVYQLSPNGSELYEIRTANGGLSGQFWFRKESRTRTGPDGTFVLN